LTLRASLPMYARPELEDANSQVWAVIRDIMRDAGVDAPDALDPDGFGYPYWEHPKLLLSQTCGYPYRTRLRGKVALVGTPDYGVEGCPPGFYCSVLVTRATSSRDSVKDLQNATMAYNAKDSQSGYHGPLAFAASHGITLQPDRVTGSHWASAKAVAEGFCDVAAIDAVTWRHMHAFDDFTRCLKEIACTKPVPGLPLITGIPEHVGALRSAIAFALDQRPNAAARLGLVQLMAFDPEKYHPNAF